MFDFFEQHTFLMIFWDFDKKSITAEKCDESFKIFKKLFLYLRSSSSSSSALLSPFFCHFLIISSMKLFTLQISAFYNLSSSFFQQIERINMISINKKRECFKFSLFYVKKNVLRVQSSMKDWRKKRVEQSVECEKERRPTVHKLRHINIHIYRIKIIITLNHRTKPHNKYE